jgi:hypothetical protein
MKDGIMVWMSWVDTLMVCGNDQGVNAAKQTMGELFECDNIGPVNKYVGCKVDIDQVNVMVKLTQPVQLQSFLDKFDLMQMRIPKTLAVPEISLHKGNEKALLDYEARKTYRKGVGKLLHLTRWLHLEIMNSINELSRFMSGALASHQ